MSEHDSTCASEQAEVWLPVVGWEGRYEVSSIGRVKSLRRSGKRTTQILKPAVNATGYWYVKLSRPGASGSQRVVRHRFIHHLVVEAFTGPRPNGYQAAHLDGDQANNSVSNIVWATRRENESHKTDETRSTAAASRLTPDLVREIRHLRESGVYPRAISRRFKIGEQTVYAVLQGRAWSWVK